MKQKVTITVDRGNFAVRGAKAGVLMQALAAIDTDEKSRKQTESVMAMAETLAVELRALGADCEIKVGPRSVLRHKSCGHTYTNAEWSAIETIRQEVLPRHADGESFIEMRNCAKCKSTIGLSDMAVAAQDTSGLN